MPSSQEKRGFSPFGNLFTRPGLSSTKTNESKAKPVQSRNSVIANEDFHQPPDIPEEDTSTSLYERLVADCLKGETFAVADENLTDEEREEARELNARTFINTIISVSATDRGHCDISRAKKLLRHKGVSFSYDLLSGPGKGYHNRIKEAPATEQILMTESESETETESETESESESESDSGSIKPTRAVVAHSDTPTPNIIEKIMLCNCPAHKHCLTCRMNDESFSLVLKDSYEGISPSSSARWVVALYSLETAVRIWVFEHTIKNPHIGPGQWQTPVSQVDEATVGALRAMINIAHDITHIRRLARNVVNNLRKAVKVSNELTSTLRKLQHAPADDEHKREKRCKRVVASKTEAKERLNHAIALLQSMDSELKLLLDKRIKTIRGDMLRNFEQSNAHWPKSSAWKIGFMARVLVYVRKDSRALAFRLREMYSVWEKPLNRGRVLRWRERAQESIVFWRGWMTDVEKGLARVAARVEVLDRRRELRCC